MELNYDYMYKMVLAGDAGVGKSSLMLRFVEDTFTDKFISTIGVHFKTRIVDICGRSVKLQIWDTAGQERFKTITSAYYRGSNGIIITYDITNRESFENVQHWIEEANRYGCPTTVKLLVGCKADLVSNRAVSDDEARDFAESQGMQFVETSAKTDSNVAEAFLSISEQILEQLSPDLFPSVILTLASCSTCSSESGDAIRLSFTKLSGESIDVVVGSKSSLMTVVSRIQEEQALRRVKLLTPSGSPLTAKDWREQAQASLSLDASKVEKPSASKVMRDKIKETFAKLDADKNGTLTFEELHEVLSQVGVDEEEVHDMLTSMDANSNGVLDFNEFVDWLYDGIVDTSREEIEGLLDSMLNVKVGEKVLLKDQGVTAVVLRRTTTDLQVKTADGAEQAVAVEDLSRI